MASKIYDLNKRVCCILSGISNPLGKCLALELCSRFKTASTIMLIDDCQQQLEDTKKLLDGLEHNINVVIARLDDWQHANRKKFDELFENSVLSKVVARDCDLAIILHNEGNNAGSPEVSMESHSPQGWLSYVQHYLYAPLALNQAFLHYAPLALIEKLVVNITSSPEEQPLRYSSVFCSCKKARDMYFRAMANEESNLNVAVLNYAVGQLEANIPKPIQHDFNNNVLESNEIEMSTHNLQMSPKPLRVTLQLINILKKLSFVSGHDVDYHDTYNL